MIGIIHRWLKEKTPIARYSLLFFLLFYLMLLQKYFERNKFYNTTLEFSGYIRTADRFRSCVKGAYLNLDSTNDRQKFDQTMKVCFDAYAPGISFSEPGNIAPR